MKLSEFLEAEETNFENVHLECVFSLSSEDIKSISVKLQPEANVLISGFCCDENVECVLNVSKLSFLMRMAGFKNVAIRKKEMLSDEETRSALENVIFANDLTKASAAYFTLNDGRLKAFELAAKKTPPIAAKVILKELDAEVATATAGSRPRDDCETGPGAMRKACKNCTCGRSTIADSAAVNPTDESVVSSACGSCYLGDEFRCSGCPYRGMPAFKPGEKVSIVNKPDII